MKFRVEALLRIHDAVELFAGSLPRVSLALEKASFAQGGGDGLDDEILRVKWGAVEVFGEDCGEFLENLRFHGI